MTKYYTSKDSSYGEEINYKKLERILNGLLPDEGYGVLLDCILPQIKNANYPHGISKPIPFLRAVNLKDQFMIIMVEYKLYIPKAENDQELSLQLDKEDFKIFETEKAVNFLFDDKKLIKIKLHNSFDFFYKLDSDALIPTLKLNEWVDSPFI